MNANKVMRYLICSLAILTVYPSSGWSKVASKATDSKILGDHYLRDGKTSSAISEYQKALKINPKSGAAYFNLAIAFYTERNIDGAISALEEVVKLDPSDIEARYNLACLKLYQRKIDNAKIHFEKAKECCPQNSSFIPLIQQGLDFVNDLEKTDSSTQALALFLMQLGEGLNPAPVAL